MVELKLFPDPFKIIAVDDDPAIALHFFISRLITSREEFRSLAISW
jgi:hypothetical protein